MEIRAVIWMVILLSVSSFQIVTTQTTGVNQAPGENIPIEGGASNGGEVAVNGPEVPVSNTEAAEEIDSLSACRDLCDENECENIPVECEYVMDTIPVLCSDDQEKCMEKCERFCTCQFECGCRLAEGCDDECSLECEANEKPVGQAVTLAPTAGAAGEGVGGAGVDEMPVVYKKEKEDSSSSEGD